MTTKEFSSEFDTLLNSYSIPKEFGNTTSVNSIELDEYEKSVFLTQAQEELVIELYSGRNAANMSLERTEEVRRYLSNLIKDFSTSTTVRGKEGLNKKSNFYLLPQDVLFITYESINTTDLPNESTKIIVKPTTQDDFYYTNRNPFRKANPNKALRLDSGNNEVEIISSYDILKYNIRYLARPNPIILTNLNDLSINGIKVVTECELNPILHKEILNRAVDLAIKRFSISVK